MKKLVSLTFWFLREKNCNTCLFHQKPKLIQIFCQGHFDLLNWNLGSQVKKFDRKAEGNFESCSAVGDQKKLDFPKQLFYLMVKIFTRVQKIMSQNF
jgi:hypothetical protein